MNRELARYFVKLIAEDLQFSFNGMGLPNNTCEWLENQLMQENFEKVEEFIKKRYDEHENTSKKNRLSVAVADSAAELPEYIEQLKNLPEKQKRIFLYGSWDVDV